MTQEACGVVVGRPILRADHSWQPVINWHLSDCFACFCSCGVGRLSSLSQEKVHTASRAMFQAVSGGVCSVSGSESLN